MKTEWRTSHACNFRVCSILKTTLFELEPSSFVLKFLFFHGLKPPRLTPRTNSNGQFVPVRAEIQYSGTGASVTNIFDFIKTNHQNDIKTVRKLHNIFIKLDTVCGVLPFNITLVFRLFTKGKTFVYMSPCSLKFDNSRIYFSGIDKNYVITGGKRMTWGNCLMLRKQSTCDVLRSEQTDTHMN